MKSHVTAFFENKKKSIDNERKSIENEKKGRTGKAKKNRVGADGAECPRNRSGKDRGDENGEDEEEEEEEEEESDDGVEFLGTKSNKTVASDFGLEILNHEASITTDGASSGSRSGSKIDKSGSRGESGGHLLGKDEKHRQRYVAELLPQPHVMMHSYDQANERVCILQELRPEPRSPGGLTAHRRHLSFSGAEVHILVRSYLPWGRGAGQEQREAEKKGVSGLGTAKEVQKRSTAGEAFARAGGVPCEAPTMSTTELRGGVPT